MIRLRVTDLESYRYWKDSEEADLAKLLADLSHTSPPTPRMQAGQAFAKFFEHADPGTMPGAEVDGWRFYFDLDDSIDLPPIRELMAEEVFETPSGPVTLVGKVDGIQGLTVRDQKLTEKWDAEKYLDSLQWRAYLVMFQANRFIYDVFVGRYHEGAQAVTVHEYHCMPFYAYPNMRADVERAVCELAEIKARHLPAAPERNESEAAE